MYKHATETITQGLSPAACYTLGAIAAAFGALTLVTVGDPPLDSADGKPMGLYYFAAFCFLISLACFTRGRLRRFIGSIIGCSLFLVGIGYVYSEYTSGTKVLGDRSEPSLVNAVMFLFLIGVPGITFAIKSQFGMKRE